MAGQHAVGRALQATDILPRISPVISHVLRSHGSKYPSTKERHIRVGVCVSGGPDSMALAYLLQTLPPIYGTTVRPVAMIVDHQARPNSANEARWVQSELENIGMASMVLKLRWKHDQHPSAMSNFESEAREKRYRAVVGAALQQDIRHIFTGHHQGDQVETVLMRLAQQQHKDLAGLSGIAPISAVPCCNGLWGVHEGLTTWPSLISPAYTKIAPPNTNSDEFDVWLPAERGCSLFTPEAMNLHRPLLSFTKADLIATCTANGVKFVTDPTNHDPTLTSRNAIRRLYASHQLPLALQTKSIMQLQTRARNFVQKVEHGGSELLRSFRLRKLYLSSGFLEVQLPFLHGLSQDRLRSISNAVSKLVEIVTPAENADMPLQVPAGILGNLFPEALDEHLADDEPLLHRPRRVAFTFRRVVFTPHPHEQNVWTLSRQPMRSTEINENTWSFKPAEIRLQGRKASTSWRLWDNRFWIQLHGNDSGFLQKIHIQPLASDLLEKFREQFHTRNSSSTTEVMEDLNKILNTVTPGKARYSLPVLTFEDKIIRFPTIPYLALDLDMTGIRQTSRLSHSVRYKNVRCFGDLNIVRKNKIYGSYLNNMVPLQQVLGLRHIPGIAESSSDPSSE